MRLYLFLVLTFPHAWAAPSPGRPACATSPANVQKKTDQLYRQYKAKIKGSFKLLDECRDKYKKRFDDCNAFEQRKKECADQPVSNDLPDERGGMMGGLGNARGGIRDAFDRQVTGIVNTSNCLHIVASCYRVAPNDLEAYQESSSALMQKCLKDAESHAASAHGDEAANYLAVKQFTEDVRAHIETAEAECWQDSGDTAENLARSTLEQENTALGKNGALDCLNEANGNRICQYSSDGSHLKPQEAKDLGGDQPAKLDFPGNGMCSGELLGDGQTVLTSGHCTVNPANQGLQNLEVYDKNGTLNSVQGNCAKGTFDKAGGADVSYCTLSSPLPANPVYVATLDPSRSYGCETVGYKINCAEEYFQGLSNSPVSMRAYPFQRDGDTGQGSTQLYQTTGTLYYNSEEQTVYSRNTLCTNGCSGGAYVIQDGNRQVVVGTHSYYYGGTAGSYAHVIPTETLNQLTIQSVDTKKLAEGAHLFQSMPY